jgi:hypothetical protein
MGLLRVRLEVTCSWRSVRAACCCSTPISSWARLLGGVSGAVHMRLLRSEGRTVCSPAWSAVVEPCWAICCRGSGCWSRMGFIASRRRSERLGVEILVLRAHTMLESLQQNGGAVGLSKRAAGISLPLPACKTANAHNSWSTAMTPVRVTKAEPVRLRCTLLCGAATDACCSSCDL